MVYFTEQQLEEFSGFSYEDFKENGLMMNATQWTSLVSSVLTTVTKVIDNFCNVPTLEPHIVTEYFSGRKSTGDFGDYTLADRTYYLFDNYQSNATVSEDTTPTSIPTWTDRVERSGTATGDYNLYTEQGLTSIVFLNNIPVSGEKNIRVVYNAGFATTSEEMTHIGTIALRMATNYLMKKKRVQEATTIRRAGTDDYGKMFENASSNEVLTGSLEVELSKYKRWMITWSSS